jgi:branched-chain amino acid transport system ATP-binding protein
MFQELATTPSERYQLVTRPLELARWRGWSLRADGTEPMITTRMPGATGPNAPAVTPALELRGICKRFGAITVADGVSFSLERRTCLGLVGPNGAGKTSLFSMIAGLIFPDAGRIWFNGNDVTNAPPYRRARLGIVRAFQIPQPFPHLTVYENVFAAAYYCGMRGRAAEQWSVEVLERVGLLAAAETAADHLRLLDRKRLELAKAMASRAELLLLDEIAGGLMDQEVDALLALIGRLKTDHTIIWIEHIPRTMKHAADRVLVLHFGRLLLDGAPDEVMANAQFREIYMGLPADAA